MNMIILTTNTNQQFATLPTKVEDANNNDIYLKFTNETTKAVFTLISSVRILDKDILYLGSNALTFLKENNFYSLVVYFNNTNEIIYKDTIFCTNQNKATYSINNLSYTLPNINNNDYITV